MISALRNKWHHYWFGDGDDAFATSLAFIRIFIHLSVLYFIFECTSSDYNYLTGFVNKNLFHPIGLYQFFGNSLFAPFVFSIIRAVALLTTIASILGLFTRPSMIISFISNMLLVPIFYFYGKWSHGHNVVFLAQLAIIFSPAGKSISIDCLLLKKLKPSPIISLLSSNNGNTKWAVRLAEIAVALMFFNAAFFKWANDPIHFGWVFSDNLRNLILVRYNTDASEIPGYLKYVGNHEWLWKTLAMGNMISQTMPIVACFTHRYPKTRLVLGAFFIVEIFGLGLFASLWFLNWLPLYAVFIDWEYFLGRKSTKATDLSGRKSYTMATLYISLFLFTYFSVGFYPRYGLQEILRPYPFTRFPMFANIVTPKPFNVHKSAEMPGGVFEVINKGVMDSASALYLKSHFYPFLPKNADEEKEQLKVISESLFSYNSLKPDTIKWEEAILSIPPYPQPIGITIKERGLIGKIEANGNCQTASSEYKSEKGGYLYILVRGYKNPEIEVRYINNYGSSQLPLKGKWDSSHTKYYLSEKPKGNNLIVLYVKDESIKGVDIYFSGQTIF